MMRVLIVDDDCIICRCLQEKIDWQDINCEIPQVSYNGMEALKIIEEFKPHIVICDIRMPLLNGIVLCRQIYEKYPDIKIIILSAYKDFDVAQMALRYNVKGYVLKPLDKKSLLHIKDMVLDIIKYNGDIEFCTNISNHNYDDYLFEIISDKNISMLDDLLSRINYLERKELADNMNIWSYILNIIFRYHREKKVDNCLIYEEEIKSEKMLKELNFADKLSFVRMQYMKVIEEEENADIVKEIQEVVSRELGSFDLSIQKLGEIFKLSPNYLSNSFKERTGINLIDYIIEKRLDFACNRLIDSDKTVKEIAEEAGYLDANYFTKLFRKRFGMTPREFRNSQWARRRKKLYEEFKKE